MKGMEQKKKIHAIRNKNKELKTDFSRCPISPAVRSTRTISKVETPKGEIAEEFEVSSNNSSNPSSVNKNLVKGIKKNIIANDE
jgi:hypothetical protein